jgi:hypothetical protein
VVGELRRSISIENLKKNENSNKGRNLKISLKTWLKLKKRPMSRHRETEKIQKTTLMGRR